MKRLKKRGNPEPNVTMYLGSATPIVLIRNLFAHGLFSVLSFLPLLLAQRYISVTAATISNGIPKTLCTIPS